MNGHKSFEVYVSYEMTIVQSAPLNSNSFNWLIPLSFLLSSGHSP